MTKTELSLANIEAGTFPPNATAVGYLLGEIEKRDRALRLIAGAKDVRGCDVIAREALGLPSDPGSDYPAITIERTEPTGGGSHHEPTCNADCVRNGEQDRDCPKHGDGLGAEIYALLVRRGFSQDEASAIANGPGGGHWQQQKAVLLKCPNCGRDETPQDQNVHSCSCGAVWRQ